VRAEQLFRWAALRGAHSPIAYRNLSNVLYFLGRREEAESLSVETAHRFPEEPRWLPSAFYLYNRGQLDSAQGALERERADGGPTVRIGASSALWKLHLIRGRLAESDRALGEVQDANLARGVSDSLNGELWAAFVDVWHRGRPTRGIEKLEATLAHRPLAAVPLLTESGVPGSGPFTYYMDAARIYALADRPDRARAVLAQFFAETRDTALIRASAAAVHSVRGEIALAERQPVVALDEFRQADRLPDGPVQLFALWHHADMGRAFHQAGMADSAIVSFERYLETPQRDRLWQDAIHLAPILQRLGALYEAKGDRTKAIEYYARFVELWRNADPELQPRVNAVRRRIEELRKSQ